MASCYHCGVNIRSGEGYRRQVLTSQSARIYFTKRGGGSYGQSYGLRTLCANCANSLDQSNKALAWKLPVCLAVSLIGAVITVRARDSFDGALGGLIFLFFVFGGAGLITFWILGLIFEQKSSPSSALAGQSTEYESLSEPSISQPLPVNQERTSTHASALDLSPYIDKIREVGLQTETLGLSFFGVYGLESAQESVERSVDIIFKMLPPSHEKDVATWGTNLFKSTFQRFLNEFSAATNPVNLDLLLRIFPGNPEESSEEYLSRLQSAAKQVLAVMHPGLDSRDEA